MLKLVRLILKNLGRNKARTTLTGLAVVVLVAVYSVVSTVTSSVAGLVAAQASQTKLLVTERWVMPSKLPLRYVSEVTSMPGVVDWTVWHYYAGFFDESRRSDRMSMGIATRADNLRTMQKGMEKLDPEAVEALMQEKSGALVGPGVLEMMGWKVGQEFTFVAANPDEKNLRFKIVGVLPHGLWSQMFFFRDDYYREASGDDSNVTSIWIRLPDAETSERVAAEISKGFENRQPSLKVETESAGIARFAERNQAVLSIIDMVVAVLLIDMVVILSNSISMTIRERRVEMAVLKVLGFQPSQIMIIVVGEAMFVGGVSGLFGAWLAWLLSDLTGRGVIGSSKLTEFLLSFPIPATTILAGLAIGLCVGLIGSIMPALTARNVKVSNVFARIE